MTDRYQLGQPRHAPEVVSMPVSRDQVVKPFTARQILEHSHNPLRVSIVETRPSRINQDRLTIGSDQQGGGTALDIDEVNLQLTGRPDGLPRRNRRQSNQDRWNKTPSTNLWHHDSKPLETRRDTEPRVRDHVPQLTNLRRHPQMVARLLIAQMMEDPSDLLPNSMLAQILWQKF